MAKERGNGAGAGGRASERSSQLKELAAALHRRNEQLKVHSRDLIQQGKKLRELSAAMGCESPHRRTFSLGSGLGPLLVFRARDVVSAKAHLVLDECREGRSRVTVVGSKEDVRLVERLWWEVVLAPKTRPEMEAVRLPIRVAVATMVSLVRRDVRFDDDTAVDLTVPVAAG